MAGSSPLKDEDCDCLDRVLESVRDTAELIARCKACGLDVAKAQEENERQKALAESLKRNFFPQRV